MKEIILLEDDPILGRALTLTLEGAGYKCAWYKSATSFEQRDFALPCDLLILDIGLPDGNGIALLKELRSNGDKTPAILLTAKDHEDSVVEGLTAGANDYVKKPFSNKELLARIKTTLREPNLTETRLQIGDLIILVEKREIWFGNSQIDLSRRQFDILIYLGERLGRVISRESLIVAIKSDGEMIERTIDSHVSQLRTVLKKIDIKNITIKSVYGIGYRMEVIEKGSR